MAIVTTHVHRINATANATASTLLLRIRTPFPDTAQDVGRKLSHVSSTTETIVAKITRQGSRSCEKDVTSYRSLPPLLFSSNNTLQERADSERAIAVVTALPVKASARTLARLTPPPNLTSDSNTLTKPEPQTFQSNTNAGSKPLLTIPFT